MLRQERPDGLGNRTVVVKQKGPALVLTKVAIGDSVPVFRLSNPALPGEPFHVAAMVPAVIPETARAGHEPPFFPVVIGERAHHRVDRRTSPAVHQGPAAPVLFEVVCLDGVVIVERAESKLLPEPDEIVAAVLQVAPELVRHRAFPPGRLLGPQATAQKRRRAGSSLSCRFPLCHAALNIRHGLPVRAACYP